MRTAVIIAYTGASLVALSVSGVAAAQSAAAPVPADTASGASATSDEASASDIIVTARRREERLQDVPQVITALTSEQLTKQNIRDFKDIQTLVPGLQIKTEANGIGSGAQIRGVQYDPNAGTVASVQLYLNDAVVDSTVLQTLYDIQQIGVERGPQGTLRGEASPSGAIAITTKRPDLYRAGGNVSVTGNSLGTMNINGGLGLPIVEGIAALRVAGSYDTSEGNRVHTIATGGDTRDAHRRNWSGRATLRVEPADWIRLQGVYQRFESDARSFDQYVSFSLANPSAAASPLLITPRDRLSIQQNPRTLSQVADSYNWRGEFRAEGQVLIYQGSRSDFTLTSVNNQDNANFFKTFDFYQTTKTHSVGKTHELRLQNETRLFEMFDYVLGVYDYKTSPGTTLTTQTPVVLPAALGGGLATIANTPISIPATTTHERSYFGNLTLHIDEATEISGGLRHIKFATPNGALIVAGNAIPTPGFNDKGTIYTASIKHNFTPNLMIYANTGTSRRPGPSVVGDFSVNKSALENSFLFLPAEKSTSYEAGFKSTWFDKRLLLNVTAYHQKFKNYPYRNPTGVYFVNYGATVSGGAVTITPGVNNFNFVAPVPIEVNGVEAELGFDITRNWNVSLSASYSLGKIKGGTVACNDINNDGVPDGNPTQPSLAALLTRVGANNLATCTVNQRSGFQSPLSATVMSEYHQPISAHVDGFVRGLYSFYGNSQGDPSFAYDQLNTYGLLNLFLGFRDQGGKWEASFFAKNLLNTVKVTSIGNPAATNYQQLTLPTFTAQAATATSSYSVIGRTPLREFGLNLRIAFGSR